MPRMQQTRRNLTCKSSSHRCNCDLVLYKCSAFLGVEKGAESTEKSLLEQKQLILRSFCLTAKPRVATRASGANGAVSSGGAFFCFFLPFGARQICHETNHWNQRQATKWMPFLHLQYFLFAATAFETRCNCTYYRVSNKFWVENFNKEI